VPLCGTQRHLLKKTSILLQVLNLIIPAMWVNKCPIQESHVEFFLSSVKKLKIHHAVELKNSDLLFEIT